MRQSARHAGIIYLHHSSRRSERSQGAFVLWQSRLHFFSCLPSTVGVVGSISTTPAFVLSESDCRLWHHNILTAMLKSFDSCPGGQITFSFSCTKPKSCSLIVDNLKETLSLSRSVSHTHIQTHIHTHTHWLTVNLLALTTDPYQNPACCQMGV